MEQQDNLDVACRASDSEWNTGNETAVPLVSGPGLRGRASHCGRGHSCTTRTQGRTMEQQDKVGVCFWAPDSECSMENKTGAPLGIEPGLRGHASHLDRGASCGTRTQTRTMDESKEVNVSFWPSNLECNMGEETGAPLGIEPGLRGLASRLGRGHSCGTRTQAREHSEALPALGSEKRVLGPRRRQISLPKTARAVARKPLCQGKKSSAKARGHTGNENTVCQPEDRPLTSPQGESSQGSPCLCCPPAFSPAPYMTMVLCQPLIVLPSAELREASALSNPCSDLTALPCSSQEYHPPEPQVPAEKFGLQNVGQEELSDPIASDQASVSATSEYEEILEAASALMTLKNSPWTWRRTHS